MDRPNNFVPINSGAGASPRAEEIFYRALEILDTAGRNAYLDGACDAELRKTVDALLADHARADAILAGCSDALVWPGICDAVSMTSLITDAEVGARIGPYTLVRRLGEGSGGIVYEAAQEKPVRRRVALKILRAGLDTRRVIDRFEAERQTLAWMEHPNIARVIDAGATTSARPYFVLELVHGTRITDYCIQARVDVPGRLRLLQQVCAAIQHAHQKGVIHRDLKPSNILVSLVDDTPVPKVIDFGIAKAMAEPSTATSSPLVATENIAGTPAYMSPEQRRGSAESDTRSDIYSLGIVLRELLLGRPSAADPESSERTTPPSSFSSADLTWIVRKATEENPDRRYQTVRGFALDLENFLTGRPVEAHPSSALYRASKLIRRNKLSSAALAAAVLALVGGLTVSTFLLVRTRAAERQEARLRAEAEERAHVARAAILLMQGKPAEAHSEIERMAGPLTQPSVEATQVFRNLATWSALRADWATAGRRLLALSRVNRFDDTDQSDNATRDLVPIAPTLIEAGDLDGYRDFHRRLLERLGQTRNPVAAEQILKGCLLLPENPASLAALDPIAAVARQSLATIPFAPENHLDAWRCAALGLWSYRHGRFEEAVNWCNRSLALQDDELARHAYSRIVRSMALTGLGRADPAQNDRDFAGRQIETTFSEPLEFRKQGYWHDWLAARILLREAARPSSPTHTQHRNPLRP